MMFNSIIFFIIPGVPHGPMALLDGTTAIGVGALMDLVEIGYGFGGLDEGGACGCNTISFTAYALAF